MTIDATVVYRLLAILPDQEAVTLSSRTGSVEGFSAGVGWTAQRLPRLLGTEGVGEDGTLTKGTADFRLLLEGQSVLPTRGDRITDSAGQVWSILELDVKLLRTTFDCVCDKVR